MASFLNLNPHNSGSCSLSQSLQLSTSFGLPNLVPEEHTEIVRVKVGKEEQLSAVDKILILLERSRPGCTTHKHQHKHLGTHVKSGQLACATRNGIPVFLEPNHKYILPPTYTWCYEPNKYSLFDHTLTKCGDISFLNLTGEELYIVEDSALNKFALTTGLWIVLHPAHILEASIGPVKLDHQEGTNYIRELRRANENSYLARVIYIEPQHLCVLLHEERMIAIGGQQPRILLDPSTSIIKFFPTTMQNFISESSLSISDSINILIYVDIQWKLIRPLDFLKLSSSTDVTETIRVKLESLMSSHCLKYNFDGQNMGGFISSLYAKITSQLKTNLGEFGINLANANISMKYC